jgi:DNA (cytosine-5)-methyltransferase 1
MAISGWPMAAIQHSLPDPTMTKDGEATSSGTRVLNPQFVEVLMGFPIGWTGFERLATRWSPPRHSVPSSFWPSDSEP